MRTRTRRDVATPTQSYGRINVELRTPEHEQLYNDLKVLATMHGLTLQEVILPALVEARERLKRRTLPLNTVVHLVGRKDRRDKNGS